MLGNNFTVKFITSRNCFLVLSEANFRKLSFQKAVKVNYDSKELYCSCVTSSEISDNNYVGIPALYAKTLGILEHQTVYISDIIRVPTLGKLMISPVKEDDYEILELSSDTVQSTLLEQIRVVNKNQKITIWISKWLHVTVRVDDAEPMSYGYLANLTEVHIAPPVKTNSIKDELNSVPEIIAPSKPEEIQQEDCIELSKLKKYLQIKKPVVFRVCPLVSPQTLTENDIIVTHPFNVFIFKQNVPKFMSGNTQKEVMLCKVCKIDAPVDFRDAKEENKTQQRSDMIVRVCVIEDYYNAFSDDTKSCFGENVSSEKYPVMYVPAKTMGTMDLAIGSKITLGTNFDFQSDVRSIELITTDKKVKNVVQMFKTFVANNVKYSKCVLNSNICIEIEKNVVCNLKFNPLADFCIFDAYALRNCKIYENTDKNVDFQKTEVNTPLINIDEICLNVCDFKNITQQAETLLSLENRNENVLIIGKSGCGKTTLAKVIAQKLLNKPHYMNVVVVSCKKYKGKSVESLHKIFAQDFQNMIYYQPSLLVLDDLHIICGRTEAGKEVQTAESLYFDRVSEMISEMIETHQKLNKISVIATGESTMKINEHVLSSRGKHLFRNVFSITELDKKQRHKMLNNLYSNKATIHRNVDFDDLSARTEGYVIQDLVDFVNKSIFESLKRNVPENNDTQSIVVTASDIDAALTNSVALALRDVQLHAPGEKDFGDVGGLESVKKMLVESMNWPAQYPDLFNDAPLRLQSGILLYGPPGVGKTLLVGAAARQCDMRLIAVKGPELLSKYIGASEQAVRAIFEKAQSARPCILFFDEFDSLAPRRGHDSTGVTDRVVNQLLTQLDGVESLTGVFVVAATSRPDLLDPALLRPGRLDKQILCPVPDTAARLDIFKALSRSLRFDKGVDLEKFASGTKGFSGADIQAVLYTAQLYAVEDALGLGKEIDNNGVVITARNMDDALKGTGPSLTKPEVARYDKIYSKFQNKKEEVDPSIKKQKATLA